MIWNQILPILPKNTWYRSYSIWSSVEDWAEWQSAPINCIFETSSRIILFRSNFTISYMLTLIRSWNTFSFIDSFITIIFHSQCWFHVTRILSPRYKCIIGLALLLDWCETDFITFNEYWQFLTAEPLVAVQSSWGDWTEFARHRACSPCYPSLRGWWSVLQIEISSSKTPTSP